MQERRVTLISCLVVITILVVAAAIVYPAFSHSRAKAMQASCLSNEKCVGLAYAMYATDNENKLPLYDNGSKPGYITSPMGRAPKVNSHARIDDAHPNDAEHGALVSAGCIGNAQELVCPSDPARLRLLSYTLNGMYLGYQQDKIVSPADKIFMIDECSVSDYVFVYYTAGNYGFHSLAEPVNFVHRHGLNCLYADGHSKWLNEQDWPLGPGDPHFMTDFGIK